MTLNDRINAFAELGKFFSQFKMEGEDKNDSVLNSKFFEEFKSEINQAVNYNGWFTKENVLFGIEQWSNLLSKEKLESWMSEYTLNENADKTIGLIMAGNIPMVGFHDFLSVLMSGHKVRVKLSSNDKRFFPFIARMLAELNDEFFQKISFVQERLDSYDAVIATGSNNTARYFNHYFKDYPSIIRQNRNSVAVLTGEESEEELKMLADDIFIYFGLGCRSVSKVFIPHGYDIDRIFNAIYHKNEIVNHAKYANNYDYNKAVYLMSKQPILDNGFFVLKEELSYGSPIATLFYEYYEDLDSLKQSLQFDFEKIQIVVSKDGIIENSVYFGQSQQPSLSDYADGVDTMEFLSSLN